MQISLERPLRATVLTFMLSVSLLVLTSVDANGEPKKPKLPPIYDTTADGERQIADALRRAKFDNRRVLLQFGANWCIWCHRLHDFFDKNSDLKKLIHSEFELVLIDVDEVDGKPHNAELVARMGRPTKHGLPVLVVLDDKGRPLTTLKTEPLEVGDSYDATKILAALRKWKPKAASANAVLSAANAVLSAAIATAKSEGKNVFLYFSATWCSWCGRMDGYLRDEKIGPAFQTAFVPVKIDIERMTGGSETSDKYGRTEEDGLPFFVILDGNGNKLANSRAPKGNVGFPAEPFEIAHFMKVIKQHGKRLNAKHLQLLENGLKKTKS